ncbi:MAG TPA: RICIN domain-containing protein, partial [Thermoanaerobaculia bacterium]|nr:RICIN domain-containing protein [Thermoanaerobaculia bacterium]
EAALPADLQGITYASYDSNNLQTSVDRTCLAIKKQIGEVKCSDCHFLLNQRSGQCLDVQEMGKEDGNPVIQWPHHGGLNQLWSLEKLSDGWFKIVSRNSGKCLQVKDASQEEDAVVEQGTYKGETNQQWTLTLTPFGNGIYQIKARHSLKCLYASSEEKETPIVQRTWRQDEGFLWWLADAVTVN